MFDRDRQTIELLPQFSPEDLKLRQILLLLADELLIGGPHGPLFADGLATTAIAHLLHYHSTQTTPLKSPWLLALPVKVISPRCFVKRMASLQGRSELR
jgi:hypothetical protein